MASMSETENTPDSEAGGVEPVDFEALGADILSGMGKLCLIRSKSDWSAIVLPVNAMPGEGVQNTIASLFSGRPAGMDEIKHSLEFLKLAVVESTETEGGARLEDLAFGEWIELLEQWSQA